MSYTFVPVPTINTGDSWTAAMHNLYVRDNFAQSVPGAFVAKGDLYVGLTGSNIGEILSVGADGQRLHRDDALTNGLRWSADSPGAEIFAVGPQSILDVTPTTLTFDTEVQDVGGFYPGSGNTLTVPTNGAGMYLCTANAYFDGATVGRHRSISLSTSAGNFVSLHLAPASSQACWLNIAVPVFLNPGNTVTVLAYHYDAGAALNIRFKRLTITRL